MLRAICIQTVVSLHQAELATNHHMMAETLQSENTSRKQLGTVSSSPPCVMMKRIAVVLLCCYRMGENISKYYSYMMPRQRRRYMCPILRRLDYSIF